MVRYTSDCSSNKTLLTDTVHVPTLSTLQKLTNLSQLRRVTDVTSHNDRDVTIPLPGNDIIIMT